jgi:hypothetical protein
MDTYEIEIKKELYFSSRGIGGSSGSCYCCGKMGSNDLCGFVKSREEGRAIERSLKGGHVLDWRPYEPNWIQVKIVACKVHLENLKKLEELIYDNKMISIKKISESIPADEFYQNLSKYGFFINPYDKVQEWELEKKK